MPHPHRCTAWLPKEGESQLIATVHDLALIPLRMLLGTLLGRKRRNPWHIWAALNRTTVSDNKHRKWASMVWTHCRSSTCDKRYGKGCKSSTGVKFAFFVTMGITSAMIEREQPFNFTIYSVAWTLPHVKADNFSAGAQNVKCSVGDMRQFISTRKR